MCLILTVFLICAVVGVPRSYFNDVSPMLGFLRLVAVPGAFFGGYGTWFYLNGALRPQHVTIDDRGVSTPSWALGWEEIFSARVYPAAKVEQHKQQLAFHVTDDAFNRVRADNRGHSGRPFGMGGLLARRPLIRTQYGTWPQASDLLPVIEDSLDAVPFEGKRPRWPY